jgi:hypothetical protein
MTRHRSYLGREGDEEGEPTTQAESILHDPGEMQRALISCSPAAVRVGAALRLVADTYTPEGVGIWLVGRKRSLDERSPLELLERGEIERFCNCAGRLVT